MDGFTGFDGVKAEADIDSFVGNCYNVYENLQFAVSNLGEVLSKKWASDNAVKFCETYEPRLEALFSEFHTTISHIESGAADAASTLAKANGGSFSYHCTQDPGWVAPYVYLGLSCSVSINNVVGRDRENVRLALDVFKTEVDSELKQLESIPNGIAFYDPAGDMIGAYNRNIAEFKSRFQELFNSMFTKLAHYIETESDNILLAKEQAKDTMNA